MFGLPGSVLVVTHYAPMQPYMQLELKVRGVGLVTYSASCYVAICAHAPLAKHASCTRNARRMEQYSHLASQGGGPRRVIQRIVRCTLLAALVSVSKGDPLRPVAFPRRRAVKFGAEHPVCKPDLHTCP